MSCNQERFINEEQVIRETYAKDIINNKYDNIKIIFYRGGYEEEKYDEENNLLCLTSSDSWIGTFKKTIDAFRWVYENICDFDYIIRTNTSTYINIKGILQFLNMDLPKDMICGPNVLINKFNNYIPYMGGWFLIIPKHIIEVLIKNWHIVNTDIVDDAGIGFVLYKFYGGKYVENFMYEVDTIGDMYKTFLDRFNSAYCVRVKDEKNYENNIIRMYGLHFLYKKMAINVTPPHSFKNVFTPYGQLKI